MKIQMFQFQSKAEKTETKTKFNIKNSISCHNNLNLMNNAIENLKIDQQPIYFVLKI